MKNCGRQTINLINIAWSMVKILKPGKILAGKISYEIKIFLQKLIWILKYTELSKLVIHSPVLLPGKSHGCRSLVGCSPLGRWESNTTEGLHFHFSLSCIGEGNGNPLQCSCLENPRDGGAWWATVNGVAQSRTRLKWLSSSSSSSVSRGPERKSKWSPLWCLT